MFVPPKFRHLCEAFKKTYTLDTLVSKQGCIFFAYAHVFYRFHKLSTTGLEQLLKVEGLNPDQELNSSHKEVSVKTCWGANSLPSI